MINMDSVKEVRLESWKCKMMLRHIDSLVRHKGMSAVEARPQVMWWKDRQRRMDIRFKVLRGF